MGKIPVFRTIGQTVGFVFGNYWALLGIFWLPLLVLGAGGYYFFATIIQAIPAISPPAQHAALQFPPLFLEKAFRWMGAFQLVFVLAIAMIRVGVAKEALGLRTGPRFVYFRFGMAEIRTLGVYFALLAFMYVSMLVVFLVVGAVFALVGLSANAAIQAHMLPSEAARWFSAAGIVAVIVIAIAWFYFVTRLFYLVIPVIVVEKRFGIMRSWELTKGNFWRIAMISIAIFAVGAAVEIVAAVIVLAVVFACRALMGTDMPAFQPGHPMPPMSLLAGLWSLGWVGFTLFAPLLYGLILAPSSFAYRALMPVAPEGDAAPLTQEASQGDLRS